MCIRDRDRGPRDQRGPAVRLPSIRAGGQHDRWQTLATGRDWHGPDRAPSDWHDPEDRTHYRKSSGYQNLGETQLVVLARAAPHL
eukprot:1441872-Alexandrium_andersonii.AAC.1